MPYIQRKQSGFTLVEIAIVLVIIGLLMGGVLKGQELITNAKVRSMASGSDGVKAAYYAFMDRYRAIPGDWDATGANDANEAIPTASGTCSGNNNGSIDISYIESSCAWNQLSAAGFITGAYTNTAGQFTTANAPTNPFGGFFVLGNNPYFTGVATTRLNLLMGGNTSVAIAAELDRKMDDGLPNTGSIRQNLTAGNAYGYNSGACNTGAGATWDVAGALNTCMIVSIF